MKTLKMSIAATALLAAASAPMPAAALSAPRVEDLNDEIKRQMDELGKTFAAFKSANDDALGAKADENLLNEKVEKINASMDDIEDKIKDLANKQAAAAIPKDDRVQDAEYTKAFNSMFRKGDVNAALQEATDADGGYLAPVEWDRTIQDALVELSPLRQICTVKSRTGRGYKKLINLKGTSSGWVGETAARPETNTPTLAELDFGWGEIYANPAATQRMLDDGEVNVEAWLAGEVQEEFALQETAAFVAGDGTNKPRGFATYVTGGANAGRHPLGNIEVIPAGTTGALTDADSDVLIDVVYSLAQKFRQGAGWVLNRQSLGAIRKMKDGDGTYLWQPSYQAGEPSTLLGYRTTEVEDMPDIAANAYAIAFGDFKKGYIINDRKGTRVLRDPFTQKPYVLFYTTKRVGGAVDDPDALKLIQINA